MSWLGVPRKPQRWRKTRGATAPPDTTVPRLVVKFVPVRCPHCKSKTTKTYKTAVPVRYHRCECGLEFRSVEVIE